MNRFIQKLHKLDKEHNVAYSLIRVFLGLALFIRGWLLVSDPGKIIELVGEDKMYLWISYVAIAHLLGGFLLTIGFFTRLGALIQIPVLFSAVFFVHVDKGLMMGGQSLELAGLVFFLLVIYFVFGCGPCALDQYLYEKKREENAE